MIEISDEERKRRYAICLKCPTRKYLIKLVDFHVDFWDCPYSCENDIWHYLEEKKETKDDTNRPKQDTNC